MSARKYSNNKKRKKKKVELEIEIGTRKVIYEHILYKYIQAVM
jgi:hypothetical protein